MSENLAEPSRQETEADSPSPAEPTATPNIPVLRRLLLTTLLACVMMLAASCMPNSDFRPDDFPIYTNAQVLSRTVSEAAHPPYPQYTVRVYNIVLATADKPEATQAYYVEQLTQMGWRLNQETPPFHQDIPPSDRLFLGQGTTCPWYQGYIITKRQDDAMTRIEIELHENVCH